jgi:hypothetical protein
MASGMTRCCRPALVFSAQVTAANAGFPHPPNAMRAETRLPAETSRFIRRHALGQYFGYFSSAASGNMPVAHVAAEQHAMLFRDIDS